MRVYICSVHSVAIFGSSLYAVRSTVAAPLPCPRFPVLLSLRQKIPFIRVLIAAPTLPGFAIIVSLQTGCRRTGGPPRHPPRYAPSATTRGICASTAAPNAFSKAAASTVMTPTWWPTTVSSCGSSKQSQEAQLAAQRDAQTPRPPGRTPALAARGRYGHASGA